MKPSTLTLASALAFGGFACLSVLRIAHDAYEANDAVMVWVALVAFAIWATFLATVGVTAL